MDFPNESLPILCGIISNTAKSMTQVMKYIYAVSAEDFYNVNIKDVFRLALLDVTDTSKLENLNINIGTKEIKDIFSSTEFSRVQHLICFSFAARIPFLKKQIDDLPIKDKQLKAMYDNLVNDGADNFGKVIYESYDENLKLLKQRQNLPPFGADWFRRYVYTYMPKLGEITNRNLYFLGCVEAMFPLYYSSLTAQMKKVIFLLQK